MDRDTLQDFVVTLALTVLLLCGIVAIAAPYLGLR